MPKDKTPTRAVYENADGQVMRVTTVGKVVVQVDVPAHESERYRIGTEEWTCHTDSEEFDVISEWYYEGRLRRLTPLRTPE